jgi:CRP-like cAMP-binding protein
LKVYFWWANRQFHFKKRQKDGSRLSMVATHKDALELHLIRKKREQQEQGEEEEDTHSAGHTTTTSDDESLSDHNEQDNMTIHAGDLSDYETDDDEKDDKVSASPQNSDFFASFPPEKRRVVKDLTAVVANMEVFSYLSSEAFVKCMEYTDYIEIQKGQILFDQGTLDGSLYAVVSGFIQCHFEFLPPTNSTATSPFLMTEDDEDEADGPLISFMAGDGDIVTSLLTMLLGLVRKCQERNDKNTSNNLLLPIVPHGISVKATGAAEVTKLVRVPPQCFLAMLDTYPLDVHRIAQTIVARMQRVTLQTVVRCLGLQKEIFQRNPTEASAMQLDQMAYHLQEWGRLKAILPTYVPEIASRTIQQQLQMDAATVAATNIMGLHQDNKLLEPILATLKDVGSIVSLSPGQTLMETGEQPDAIYMILHGGLDVGMMVPGASPVLKQSTRRASLHKTDATSAIPRRHIFPHYAGFAAATDGNTNNKSRNHRKSTSPQHQQQQSNLSVTSFSRIYTAVVGETVGRLSVFTGDASLVTVRNSSEWESAILFKIPKEAHDKLVAEHPTALTQCLDSILGRLVSPIVCLLDWNVEWMHVQAGEDGTFYLPALFLIRVMHNKCTICTLMDDIYRLLSLY